MTKIEGPRFTDIGHYADPLDAFSTRDRLHTIQVLFDTGRINGKTFADLSLRAVSPEVIAAERAARESKGLEEGPNVSLITLFFKLARNSALDPELE